jgi:hypothetical protein
MCWNVQVLFELSPALVHPPSLASLPDFLKITKINKTIYFVDIFHNSDIIIQLVLRGL